MRNKRTIIVSLLFLGFISSAMILQLSFLNSERSPELNPTPSSYETPTLTQVPGGNLQNHPIFWFLHITDTQNIWYNSEREDWFGRFFNETAKTIDPMMIFNTGDLVDSDYSGFLQRHYGQLEYEWATYARILNETGQNSTNYFDMLGNHDAYADPGYSYYQNYSIQKRPYYDFALELPFGKYHFVVLNMAEDTGVKYPFSLFGHLNKTELDWYEHVLESNTDADLTFTFGHMPAYEVYEGRFRYFNLNRKYDVDFYLTGHGHENTFQMVDNRMPSWETGHLTDTYRIVAIDNNIISTSVQAKNKWPVGLITSPVDVRNINPGFNQSLLQNPGGIRMLAWDPNGIAKVEWRYQIEAKDEMSWSEWTPMIAQNGPLYSAPWSVNIEDDKSHLIQARITSLNGTVKIEEIEYRNQAKIFFNWTYRGAIIVVFFFGLVVGTPVAKYSLRKTQRIAPKRREEIVDSKIRKLLIVKFMTLILIPLTITELIPGSLVALFGWGVIGRMGIVFNDIAVIVGACIMIFSIYLPLLNMSPRKRYWLGLIVLPLSLLLEVTLVVVTVILIDYFALIAPGLYALMGLDFLLYRRLFQIKKKK